jgi:ABC-2 type transport system permease protein
MGNSALAALLRKDAREQLKTYRLWIALAVFLIFGITAPLITKNLPKLIPKTEQFTVIMQDPTIVDSASQYFNYLIQMGLLLVILLGMGCVAGERSQGLLAMVLSKPVRRRDLLASKVAVNGCMLAGALVAGTAVFYGYTVLLFEYFPAGKVLLSMVPAAFFLWFVLALTVFWSVLAPSSIAAGGLSFLSAVILLVVPGLFSASKRFGPSYLMEAGKSIAVGRAGFGEALPSLLVTAGLIALCLWAALFFFGRRDV